MATIYGIEVLYVKKQPRPVLVSAEVIKETPKYYIVNSHHNFLNYRSQIEKDSALSFSPRHAWETYIDKCNKQRANLRIEGQQLTEFQSFAISELANLSEGEA